MSDVAVQRNQLFGARLGARWADIAATSQPEIPRLVGHTLRLLNLLRSAWTAPANSPRDKWPWDRALRRTLRALYAAAVFQSDQLGQHLHRQSAKRRHSNRHNELHRSGRPGC